MAGGWMSIWRWGQYSGALLCSVGIPVVGAIAEKVGGWVIPLMILYALFATSLGLFVLSFLERSPMFIIRCLYYLVCVGITLALFNSMSKTDSGSLYLWVPLCTMIGIFVGLGLSQCWVVIPWTSFRRSIAYAIARVTESVVRVVGPEDSRPILPQYSGYEPLPPTTHPSSTSSPSPSRMSEGVTPTSSPVTEEDSPPSPSTQRPLAVPQPPEYNPWASQQ